MSNQQNNRWDIFCKIVDNYGDIGICWRLSQQLVHEHQLQVRLFIDEYTAACKIITGLHSTRSDIHISQSINGVEICAWPSGKNASAIRPANVVLESFSCGLPDIYVQQMLGEQGLSSKTIWINLEYLSAEAWVPDFHGKPSRHPSLGLTKHYFFPGFSPDTGGLIRESTLIAKRDAFLNAKDIQINPLQKKPLQKDFWQKLIGNDAVIPDEKSIRISLFCYPCIQINQLFLALATGMHPISVFLPFNGNIALLNNVLTDFKLTSGQVFHQGNLTVYLIPFLSQAEYDRLLWVCDLNFVRGEDSWVRAIWAGKPFIWQPYIQTDGTHIKKLKAFLEVYFNTASPEVQSLLHNAHLAWSLPNIMDKPLQADITAHEPSELWRHLILKLDTLHNYAYQRANAFIAQPDLASKLVIFTENLL